MAKKNTSSADVVLIGAGIMSATLGMLLKQLQPHLKIEIFERLDNVAAESSDAWNNAGTGHSAFFVNSITHPKERMERLTLARQKGLLKHLKCPSNSGPTWSSTRLSKCLMISFIPFLT